MKLNVDGIFFYSIFVFVYTININYIINTLGIKKTEPIRNVTIT